VSPEERRPFPLVPRWRLTGLPFGEQRSVRRGPGSDVAGSREYVPGDPVSSIDWYASARLSSARGREQFVVREHFEDEAPRVVVIADRRPSMALYDLSLPWLSKPSAAAAVIDAVVVSTLVARGEVGYLDLADDSEHPYWLPPRAGRGRYAISDRVAEGGWDAPPDTLERAFAHLHRVRAALPPGSFVFVVSDFLGELPAAALLRATALRWDVVPVVVQDPVWEQSFPELPAVVVPFADAATGRVVETRLRGGEARERRRAHEARLDTLLGDLRRMGLEPVVVGTSDPIEIDRELLGWAERRRRSGRRRR
jgi:uncharacterized protein (DUF58 family)